MDGLTLALAALATWRTAYLFTSENGPFHVFLEIRELAGITHDQDGKVASFPLTFFGELLSCVWCFSIWAGAFWTLFFVFLPEIAFWAAFAFSASALAIIFNKVVEM